jgi:hypothetical protein
VDNGNGSDDDDQHATKGNAKRAKSEVAVAPPYRPRSLHATRQSTRRRKCQSARFIDSFDPFICINEVEKDISMDINPEHIPETASSEDIAYLQLSAEEPLSEASTLCDVEALSVSPEGNTDVLCHNDTQWTQSSVTSAVSVSTPFEASNEWNDALKTAGEDHHWSGPACKYTEDDTSRSLLLLRENRIFLQGTSVFLHHSTTEVYVKHISYMNGRRDRHSSLLAPGPRTITQRLRLDVLAVVRAAAIVSKNTGCVF